MFLSTMNSKSKIKTTAMVRNNEVVVWLMAILVVVMSSCSKEEMTYKKIEGTWTVEHDPSCRWTFDEYVEESSYAPYLHINNLSTDDTTYKSILLRYRIDGNTLTILPFSYSVLGNNSSNLSIEHISNNRLRLSGTIIFVERYILDGVEMLDVIDEIGINYEFQKSN